MSVHTFRMNDKYPYLDHLVRFGGEWVTIGWLYADFGDELAGLWLAGYFAAGNKVRIP